MGGDVIIDSLTLLLAFSGVATMVVFGDRYFKSFKRKNEEHLEEAVRKLKKLKFSIDLHSLVVTLDKNFIIQEVNSKMCETSNYTTADLIDAPYHQFIEEHQSSDNLGQNPWETIGKANIWRGFLKFNAANNKSLWLETTFIPMTNNHGDVVEIIGIHTDVTTTRNISKKLEQSIAQANAASKAKSEFLANMSHEMRTPLASIIGFINLLEQGNLNEKQRNKYYSVLKRNGIHLAELIDDILDFSKIEAGELVINKAKTCLVSEINSVNGIFQRKAEEKNIQFIVEYKGTIPQFIKTDAIRLRQILINLIGNSIKFTNQGYVKLTIEADSFPENDLIRFRVSDTGRGILKTLQNSVFDPFTQGHILTQNKVAGTGLGLSLSRRLAKELGGDIKLCWSQANRGSIFEAEINCEPIADSPSLSPIQSPNQNTSSNTQQALQIDGLNILVVEDSPDLQLLVKTILKSAGANVSVASNGIKAISLAQNNTFDVILMDIQLPKMSGYEVTVTLRGQGFNKPIIALTAHATKNEQIKAKAAGCNDFCSKPVKTECLIKTINYWHDKLKKSGGYELESFPAESLMPEPSHI